MAEPATITIAGLARRWQISERQVRYLLEQRQLDKLRIGTSVRIGMRSVNAYERAHSTPAITDSAAADTANAVG